MYSNRKNEQIFKESNSVNKSLANRKQNYDVSTRTDDAIAVRYLCGTTPHENREEE